MNVKDTICQSGLALGIAELKDKQVEAMIVVMKGNDTLFLCQLDMASP